MLIKTVIQQFLNIFERFWKSLDVFGNAGKNSETFGNFSNVSEFYEMFFITFQL